MCLSISLKRKRKNRFYINMWQSINLDLPPSWILRLMLPTWTREGRKSWEENGAGRWTRLSLIIIHGAKQHPKNHILLAPFNSLSAALLPQGSVPSSASAWAGTILDLSHEVKYVLRIKCSPHVLVWLSWKGHYSHVRWILFWSDAMGMKGRQIWGCVWILSLTEWGTAVSSNIVNQVPPTSTTPQPSCWKHLSLLDEIFLHHFECFLWAGKKWSDAHDKDIEI